MNPHDSCLFVLVRALYIHVDEVVDPRGAGTSDRVRRSKRHPMYYYVQRLHETWMPRIQAEKDKQRAEQERLNRRFKVTFRGNTHWFPTQRRVEEFTKSVGTYSSEPITEILDTFVGGYMRTIALEVEREDVPIQIEADMAGEWVPACKLRGEPSESWAEIALLRVDGVAVDSFHLTHREYEELEDRFWEACRCA